MNELFFSLVARERLQEALQDVERVRLVRRLKVGSRKQPTLRQKVLVSLGRRFIQWGNTLQRRARGYDAFNSRCL